MHRPATTTLRVPPLARSRSSRAALAGVLALAGALGACSTQSPAQTTVPYQPADGVNTSVGTVLARGLVVVAAAKGSPGVLVGSVINTGGDPVTVTFLTADQVQNGQTSGATMQLKAGEQSRVTGVQFASLASPPGALASIVLQTPRAGQTFVDVPVLPPGGYYSTATPTPGSTGGSTGGSTAATG